MAVIDLVLYSINRLESIKMKLLLKFMLIFICITALNADEIKLCGDPNYPPFNWSKKGKIIGVGPEVIQIIFKELGHTVNNTYNGNWARCLHDIKLNKRAIFTAGYKTEKRKKFMTYTKIPLKDDPQVIIVKKGKEFTYNTWNDLKGKIAGHILGSTLGDDFDRFLKKNVRIERVSSRLQNFKKLDLERIDFEVVGLWSTIIQMKRFGYYDKLTYLKKPISTENMYIAISKKSKFVEYIPYIEKRLEQMHKNGFIDKLIDKYVNQYSFIE